MSTVITKSKGKVNDLWPIHISMLLIFHQLYLDLSLDTKKIKKSATIVCEFKSYNQ